MKVGIVVPYSWSFGGGVVDHADAQRRALAAAGIETRLLIGNDHPAPSAASSTRGRVGWGRRRRA